MSFVPASDVAAMQYRVLECFKIKMLNKLNKKWNAKIILSPACIQQLLWWRDNIMTMKLQKSLTTLKVTVELFSDACNLSWVSTVGSRVAQAYFSVKQQQLHINSKELLAVWFGVQAHREVLRNQHIKIFSDNSCTVGTLKQKGSCDPLKDQVTRQIYEFVWQMGSTLEVAFIAGVDNGTADHASRVIRCSEAMEWSLDPGTFAWIQHWIPFKMDIDLFANYHNAKLPTYCSFCPDPGAKFIDAFSIDWAPFTPFIFCPFRMLPAVLRKLRDNQVIRAGVIVPLWFSAPWWVKHRNVGRSATNVASRYNVQTKAPMGQRQVAPVSYKGDNKGTFCNFVRSIVPKKPFPPDFYEIIAGHAWRSSTSERLDACGRRWLDFCQRYQKNPRRLKL